MLGGMKRTNMLRTSWKKNKWMIVGLFLLVTAIVLALLSSNASLSFIDFLQALTGREGADETAFLILSGVRAPRAVAGIFCGIGLSVAGLLMQEALNNQLAAPSVMGINSGAGLFALVGSCLLHGSALLRGAFSFAGAIVSIALVLLISVYSGSRKSTMILSGVAVSAMMSAFTNLIITLRPDSVSDKAAFQLGSLQSIPMPLIVLTTICVVIGTFGALFLAPGMELFKLGDEMAMGLGLSVRSYRYLCVFLAAFLSAAAVTSCGLISFVGLIIPNLVRRMETERSRMQVLLCVVWGGALVLFADTLAKTLFYPYELPVGMILSILGAPFFIMMIISRKKRIK